MDQAYRLSQGMSRLHATIISLTSPEPPHVRRLEAMIAWGGLPAQRGDG